MAAMALFLSEPLSEPVNASSHLPAHPPLDSIHPSPAQLMLGLDSSEPSCISAADVSLNSQPQQLLIPSNTSPPTNTTHSASSSPQPQPPLGQAPVTDAVAPAQQSTSSQSMFSGQLGSLMSLMQLGATPQSSSPSNVPSAIENVHLDPTPFCPSSTRTPPSRDLREKPSQDLPSSSETETKPSLDLDTPIQHPNFHPPDVEPSIQLDLPSGSLLTADQAIKHPHLSTTPVPIMPTTPPASSSALVANSPKPSPSSEVVATAADPSIPTTSQSELRAQSGHSQDTQSTLADVRLPQASSSATASAPGKDAPTQISSSTTTTTTITKSAASQSTTPVEKIFHPKEWKKRLADIRYYLDQISISPKTASMKLGEILSSYRDDKADSGKDWSTVPLDGRLEVMLAIRYNGASPQFLRAWIRHKKCLNVLNCWLKDAVESFLRRKKDPAHVPSNSAEQELPERTAILLHILQLLEKSPITIEIMKAHRFGICIAKINQHAQEFPDYITALAHVIESQWRQKVQAAARNKQLTEDARLKSKSPLSSTQSGPTSNGVIAAEARKPLTSAPALNNQHSASTPTAAASHPRPSNSATTLTNGERATKPNAKIPLSNLNPNRPAVTESRKRQLEAKSDPNEAKKRKVIVPAQPAGDTLEKGLFGRPDKMKLPNFTANRNVPSTMLPKPAPTASPAPTFDPFAQAMSLLKDRPAYNEEFTDFPTATTTSTKTNNPRKPAKRVRFRSEEELCQVKIVERLVYEGDQDELPMSLDGILMSDAHEGRYLHQASCTLDEEMEWESPKDVILTSETKSNLETSPLVSLEASIQEARERERESVSYLNEQEIPHTPQEPPLESPHGEDVPPAKQMKLGGKLLVDPEVVNALSQVHPEYCDADADADAAVTDTQAISSLISQLSPPVPLTSASQPGTTDLTNETCHVTDHNQPVPSSILSGPGYPHHGLTRYIPDHSERDLPPHLDRQQAFLPSSPAALFPSAKKKRKRNRNKNKNKNLEQVQSPPAPPRCRYGSDCSFRQNCRFMHDDTDWA